AERRARADRRAGRAARPWLDGDERLLGRRRGHGAFDRRGRLAALRRPRADGLRWLRVHHRPREGDDHPRRREHLSGRDRGRAAGTAGRARRERARSARRALRRAGRVLPAAGRGRLDVTRRHARDARRADRALQDPGTPRAAGRVPGHAIRQGSEVQAARAVRGFSVRRGRRPIANMRAVEREALSRRTLLALAGGVAVVLAIFAGGYGYHRDELYFLVAGHHPAWGYADQGPLTPLLARAMDALDPGSLTVLRLPSALMAGATVFVTGLTAFELGAGRRAQVIATSCAAVASVVLVVGHLLSTTTFDLLAWALVTWLVARVIRTGDERLWLVAGLALLNKPLIAFLLVGLAVGVVAVGPRRLLRSPWLWAGAALALVMWSP